MTKQELVEEIHRRTQQELKDEAWRAHQACLNHAVCTVLMLREHGFDAILQAGEAYWARRVADREMDIWGYGCQVEEEPFEFHAWAAIRETQEIVDVCTRYWPIQYYRITGKTWPRNMRPPDFLWASRFPGAIYIPQECAISLTHALVPFEKWHEMTSLLTVEALQRREEVL